MDSREFTISTYGKRLQEARDKGKYWKQEEDLARNRLLALMEPNSIQEFPDIVITSFVHEQRRVSLPRLRDEYPDVAEICTEVHTHTRIETHRREAPKKSGKMPLPPPVQPTGEKLDSPGYIEYLIQQHLPRTEEMLPGE